MTDTETVLLLSEPFEALIGLVRPLSVMVVPNDSVSPSIGSVGSVEE